MINVTKTYLPPLDKYISILRRAWDKAWITNNGELVQELEAKLKAYLGVKHLLFCSNGTIVLQMALKAYEISGEVITTPFSYVATTNALLWEDCIPVFVDIEPVTFCIDPDKIEAAITEKTQAILATHVYGYPCAVEKIKAIAEKHKLKVIYDGAHAFGCEYKGKSLLSYGDISTCSFHATKLFHTVEGGCIITDDDETARKLMLFRQFGHINDDYYSVGINAKNSEFHAAMGLCIMDSVQWLIDIRKEKSAIYDHDLDHFYFKRPENNDKEFCYNFSYYPILFESENALLTAKDKLMNAGIGTRRYFYPSLNKLPFHTGVDCRNAEDISRRILCLPLYHDLTLEDQKLICAILQNEQMN